jgi:hypothetical protein
MGGWRISAHLDADLCKTVEEIFGEGCGGHETGADGGNERMGADTYVVLLSASGVMDACSNPITRQGETSGVPSRRS